MPDDTGVIEITWECPGPLYGRIALFTARPDYVIRAALREYVRAMRPPEPEPLPPSRKPRPRRLAVTLPDSTWRRAKKLERPLGPHFETAIREYRGGPVPVFPLQGFPPEDPILEINWTLSEEQYRTMASLPNLSAYLNQALLKYLAKKETENGGRR